MENQFSRTEILIGQEAVELLHQKKVAIFGVGGVGGYVLEGLARAGVEHFLLVDNDDVALSNINRQIIATHQTVGRKKVEVAQERVLDITPNAEVEILDMFYLPENSSRFDFTKYDYVVDAIDTVSAKIDIICRCKANNVPVISAMGAGNKMNPAMLEVSDISKTEMDPLAKVMRRELKKRGVKKLKVVYSKEKPLTPKIQVQAPEGSSRRSIPGSMSFVPSVSGLIIASEVVKDLINYEK